MGNIKLNIIPYSVEPEAVISALQSDGTNGLSASEAQKRFKEYGANKIESKKGKSVWLIFLSQFKSPIVWLLVFAAGLSFYFGEILDAIAILTVILINALIGFYMEYQAERSMNALKKLSAVPAKVLRDKKLEEINAEDIVPGDVIYIEAGDMVPADGRIFNASQVQIDESALTGESVPVEKQIEKIQADTTLAERNNMLYKGTYSTKGNGYMVVTDTGMDTELGKIARMVQSAEQAATPLEKKLEDFSKKLIWITVGLVVVIFVAGILNGQKFLEMLETSIALAVAAIPEGLPIVATMALAQGMMKMAKYNVIVKKLSAVETLGGTNVICTDKTGTLTQNKIEVNKIVTPADNAEALEIINRIAVLCNTAELQNSNGSVKEIGDPLETGLLKFALKNNFNIQNCRSQFPKIKEEPFSSETKIMATLHKTENDLTIYAKGASEELLKHCDRVVEKEGITELNAEKRERWMQKAEELANSGLRVIAGAYKPNAPTEGNMTENLVFVGLFGMIDPPREEVFAAIEECKSAGINVIMITGDHPATAKNIAMKLGIADNNNIKAMVGKEMGDYEHLTEQEKSNWLDTKIFARVSPKQKLDLVAVLQERKYIVGMTGDGVNDAPALKKADIGIAMGLRGTQVSQEVADMVLKDDSFSSIVIAIKQGRIIFDNIRKFVIFLLSCNLSELIVIATASVFNLHFQLFALQILFINLITDVLPALALGVSEGSPDIMQRPPRNMNEPIIDRKRWTTIFFYSIVIGAISVGAVFVSHFTVHKTELWNPELCNNILFFTLIFSQLLHVLNMGGNHSSFFKSEVFRNKYVWGAIALSVAILIGMYAIEPVRKVLSLYEMSANDWLISVGASVVSLIIIQVGKKLKIAQQ
ncbi:MAG: calcium-translocating P-type ATPase, PMCA-type [Bacteroidota bacterium]|nr:calcium-translocating P-type ATPase, PMCA-type [Bacteroidota bacterium]MDP3147335.1 calcium-translocating P-type ATPase, PMCA-type [Bacteroidota bacterium]